MVAKTTVLGAVVDRATTAPTRRRMEQTQCTTMLALELVPVRRFEERLPQQNVGDMGDDSKAVVVVAVAAVVDDADADDAEAGTRDRALAMAVHGSESLDPRPLTLDTASRVTRRFVRHTRARRAT